MLYRLKGVPGDADWVADFWSRAEAEEYVRNLVADEARADTVFAAIRKI